MIRPARPTDQSFIAATWARSMLSTHAHERHMSSRTGHQVGNLIDRVLDRPDTRALVACTEEQPDYILGWVLYCEGPRIPTIFYVYTRRDERQRGIAAALLARVGVKQDAGVVCTSIGPSSSVLRRRYPAAVFVPLVDFLEPG